MNQTLMKNQLLQITTADGLYLHGYYAPTENKKVCLLHIHGFEGNFYENNFVHVLARNLQESQIGFLVVNTRGNGRVTDFNTVGGEVKKIGAWHEQLEEAHLDISAWLECLVAEGYQKIVLMGHSLGTYKVVRYMLEGQYASKVDKLILLAPFDKKGFLRSSGRAEVEELLRLAQIKVDQGQGRELVTDDFEEVGMSYQTFLSWYKQDDLGRVFEFCTPDYDFPALHKIKIPTKIIVGSKDEFFYLTNPDHPQEAMDLLLKHIPNAQGIVIEDSVHSFKPHEDVMAREVCSFVLGNP
jgi:pimeloyl-ACP methyl ester carboxylesterase